MRTTTRRTARPSRSPRRAKKLEHSWKWKALSGLALVSLIVQTSAFGLFLTPLGAVKANVLETLPVPSGLTIHKTINTVPPAPGQLEYKIAFLNNTGHPITDMVVEDALEPALTYVPGTARYYFNGPPETFSDPQILPGRILHWEIPGNLADGEFGVVKFAATISTTGNDYPDYPKDCSIVNDATIAALTPTIDSLVRPYLSAISEPVTYPQNCEGMTRYAPDLQVDKKIINGGELPDSITYLIHYSNHGNWPAENVVLTDTLPYAFDVSAIETTPPGTYDQTTKTITWTTSEILQNAPEQALTVKITPPTSFTDDQGCRQLSNEASIAQTPLPPLDTKTVQYAEVNLADNTSATTPTATYYGACSPRLSLTKDDGVATTTSGAQLTYTLHWTVANDDAPHLVLQDVLPNGLTFVDASGSRSYDAATRTVTWTYDNVAPDPTGMTETVTVAVDQNVSNGATITNPATLQAYQAVGGEPIGSVEGMDTDVINNPVVPPSHETLLAPLLTMTKTADKTTAQTNDTVNYTIVIKNTGNMAATNLTLHDVLPNGMVFSDNLASDRTWTISPAFAPGDTTTIAYAATVSANAVSGSYTNIATASATNHAPVVAQATVTVKSPKVLGASTGAPKLTVTKTADASTAHAGDNVTFTIVVKNDGAGDATNVALSDFLPEGLVFTDDHAISRDWTVGTLNAGQSATFKYKTTVTDTVITGTYTNVVDVSYAEGDPIEASASVDVHQGKVLGAETLADTGPGIQDDVIFLTGVVLLFVAAAGFRKSANLA